MNRTPLAQPLVQRTRFPLDSRTPWRYHRSFVATRSVPKEFRSEKMTTKQKKRYAIILVITIAAIGGTILTLALVQVNDYVYGSGYFSTLVHSEVRSPEQQPIKNILVEDGDTVAQGQVLIELEDKDVLEVIREREADIRLIEAQVEHQRADNRAAIQQHKDALAIAKLMLDNAQREFDRAMKLAETDAISAEEMDRRKFALEKAREQHNAEQNFSTEAMEKVLLVLERRVELAKQHLDQAKARLDKRRIKSPLSGALSLRTLAVGEIIEPGRIIGEVFDTSSFIIKVKISERHLHKVKVGQEASAKIASYPHDIYGYFPGTVATMPEFVTPTNTGDGYFVSRIQPEEPAAKTAGVTFRPGMSADVRILAGKTSILDSILSID